jgi:hypothetical protein
MAVTKESKRRTPVLDKPCNCNMQGAEHTDSAHGASPEWGEAHYWVIEKQVAADPVDRLMGVLNHAFRFPHNVNMTDLVGEVYGRTNTNAAYLRGKVELIDRKGFTWWWCELDLPNQEKVARIMIKRYGSEWV